MTFSSKPAKRPPGRRRRLWLVIGLLSLGAIIFVVLYFEPHTALFDDKVDEALPGLEQVLASTTTTSAPPTQAEPSTETTQAEPSTETTQAVPSTEPLPAAPAASPNSLGAALLRAKESGQPVIVSTGTFFSGEHETKGTALVVALSDGSLVVRFEDLETDNGPDLRVVLSPEPASDSIDYDDRLILGELKGNIGDQNYEIGADVDLSRYQSVVIWCERFSVAFGAASIDVVV